MSAIRRLVMAAAIAVVAGPAVHAGTVSDELLSSLQWRCIGPSRGGRASSVAGVAGDPLTYYMGACGGGIWKTADAGHTWRPISDGFLSTGSVGAIAVAPSDANVIYAGMGEPDIRGNFSHGDGVYRSIDAGRTWTHMGLADTRQIGRIVVDPRDPDVAMVAALGHAFGPNAQRGVFRTTDGGISWSKVLYIDDRTGAIDVAIDPTNPRIVFAGMWAVSRTPWSLSSGSESGGLYRSRDGGVTWTKLGGGLPDGLVGKIGVSASAARPGRVWAIVEAASGGLFRSDDSGDSWRRVNEDRSLRQRAWYYSRVIADPVEADTVYVMNVAFHKSRDGGSSFSTIRVPHSDNHALWIDPNDNRRMINANDGGANVSFDGGSTWSRQDNQPTAQFYRVAVDNSFPYRVLGAQQDNSTASISSRNRVSSRRWWPEDFYAVGGGESGYVTPRPDEPDVVYAGSYGGYLTRYDRRTRRARNIMVWPENPIGGGADVLEQRFQWTFPIVISPHDPDIVYTASQMLFRSEDGGETWDPISEDLSTNDKTKQRSSGGPITKDNTGVEYYCTIFTVAESPIEEGLIWAGTDDGLVHITRDGGRSWTDVTPPDMGDWPLISMIEASPHDAETAYVAVTRYKMDDFRPAVYRTTDAVTWTLIVNGIDNDAFVRSVRVDPERAGLLYAATETGVWMSTDDGGHWQSLQLELPVVPVTDLAIKDDDLVISTQGRSFWILSGLSLLRQHDADGADGTVHLFAAAPAWRVGGAAAVHYRLAEAPEGAVSIAFLDEGGNELQSFASDAKKPGPKPAKKAGVNTFRWNLRLDAPRRVPGAVGWPGNAPGPRVPPGMYTVRLSLGEETFETPLEILPDPRLETTSAEYAEVFEFQRGLRDAIDSTHEAINTIRGAQKHIDAAVARAVKHEGEDEIKEAAEALKTAMGEVEQALIQTKTKAPQDALNFPVRLNDKLAGLMMFMDDDHIPTPGVKQVFDMLEESLDEQLELLEELLDDDVRKFNRLVEKHDVPAVVINRSR